MKRLCCTFHNEHSAATFVWRCDEDIDTRNARAIVAAVGHLQRAAAALRAPLPRQVVLVSADDAIVREMHRAGLGASVVSMEQYIEVQVGGGMELGTVSPGEQGMCGAYPRLSTLHSSLEMHRQRVLAEEKRKALQSEALGGSVTASDTPSGFIYREVRCSTFIRHTGDARRVYPTYVESCAAPGHRGNKAPCAGWAAGGRHAPCISAQGGGTAVLRDPFVTISQSDSLAACCGEERGTAVSKEAPNVPGERDWRR